MKSNNLADYGYISALIGSLILQVYAFFVIKDNIMQEGYYLFDIKIISSKNEAILLILIVSALLMFITETIIQFFIDKQGFIAISPDIKNKKYLKFFLECILIYLANLLLFYLVVLFYRYAPEYGNVTNGKYYRPWFFVLDRLFIIYAYLSIIYIPVTRIFKYSQSLEKKENYHLFIFIIGKLFSSAKKSRLFKDREADYKNIVLGLIVKIFFIPLMTVFFFENFNNLIRNINYIFSIFNLGFPVTYNIRVLSKDIYNIGLSFVITIDILLAWGGYIVSSRWIASNNISVEPTVLGWFVALICYPPFQLVPNIYFPIPSETAIFNIPNDYIVLIFSILCILSFFIYMVATMLFGLRFSNLTNRGIIRVGLYSYIRHPAYASKNFAWWFILMPYILYRVFILREYEALTQVIGLCSITYIYYLRAITEERHLSQHPDYIEYCKNVPYRFVPGVL